MGNFVQTCNGNPDQICNKDRESIHMGTGGSYRGTDGEAGTERYTIRTDPTMKTDIYKMLTTYKQKHLFDHFKYLNRVEKEELIDDCGTVDFVVQDFIFHQLIKKSFGNFAPPEKMKHVKDYKQILSVCNEHDYTDTSQLGKDAIANGERKLNSRRRAFAWRHTYARIIFLAQSKYPRSQRRISHQRRISKDHHQCHIET